MTKRIWSPAEVSKWCLDWFNETDPEDWENITAEDIQRDLDSLRAWAEKDCVTVPIPNVPIEDILVEMQEIFAKFKQINADYFYCDDEEDDEENEETPEY